jgi:hypothetical protein
MSRGARGSDVGAGREISGFDRRTPNRVLGRDEMGLLRLFIVLLMLFSGGCGAAAEKPGFQLKNQPEIRQVKPSKPVKVKLHRNAKGEYSWDLNGDNVDEIVNTDRRLRKLLKIQ